MRPGVTSRSVIMSRRRNEMDGRRGGPGIHQQPQSPMPSLVKAVEVDRGIRRIRQHRGAGRGLRRGRIGAFRQRAESLALLRGRR